VVSVTNDVLRRYGLHRERKAGRDARDKEAATREGHGGKEAVELAAILSRASSSWLSKVRSWRTGEEPSRGYSPCPLPAIASLGKHELDLDAQLRSFLGNGSVGVVVNGMVQFEFVRSQVVEAGVRADVNNQATLSRLIIDK
jgi:hypothetical protein